MNILNMLIQNEHFYQSLSCCRRGKNCFCWKWHWMLSQSMASYI